jgi:hypothetical protein
MPLFATQRCDILPLLARQIAAQPRSSGSADAADRGCGNRSSSAVRQKIGHQLADEAHRPARRDEGAYLTYATEEQRSRMGWIVCQMLVEILADGTSSLDAFQVSGTIAQRFSRRSCIATHVSWL